MVGGARASGGHEVSQNEGNEEGMVVKLDGFDHAKAGPGQNRRV